MPPEPAASPDASANQSPAAESAPVVPPAPKSRSFFGKLYHDLSPEWSLLRILTFVGIPVAGLLLFIYSFLPIFPIQVDGISMLPTYKNGSLNLVNKLAFLYTPPKRGDIVAVKYRSAILERGGRLKRDEAGETLYTNEVLLKRVIGLPGESVEFDHGRLLVDGKPIEEPYALYGPFVNPFNQTVTQSEDWWIESRTLGTNEYWVIGDNRTMPPQLHTHPRVKRDAILGEAVF